MSSFCTLTEGAPKASLSAPVRGRLGHGARNPASPLQERYCFSPEHLKSLQHTVISSCTETINLSDLDMSCMHCRFKPQPQLIPSPRPEGQMKSYKFPLLNSRSLPKHTAELFIVLIEENILFLTETWMTPHSEPDMVQVLPPPVISIKD